MIGRRKSRKAEDQAARHRRSPEEGDLQEYDADDALTDEAPDGAPRRTGPEGPWDAEEVADLGAENRIDLGGIWVPGMAGMELRLEVEEESGSVLSVVCVLQQSAVQLRALAAPRSGGLWQEVRAEMAHEVREQGGEAQDSDGPFGAEVLAAVPTQGPEGHVVRQDVRFAGIERPRWLLQVVFTGDAVHDPFAAAPLESLVRNVVVVRGSEPMARGEQLELRLPPQAPPPPRAGEEADGPDYGDQEALNPFARGPEITEIR